MTHLRAKIFCSISKKGYCEAFRSHMRFMDSSGFMHILLDYCCCVGESFQSLNRLITQKQVVDDSLIVIIPTTFYYENLFCI